MARQFGHTWWGRAWVDALENRARLDPNRLPRGRTYARHGRVSTLHLAPGEVTAFVRGNRPGRYRVLVRVRTYGDAEWERLVATIAGRAAHAAALLDGELDPSVADDARDAGVDLLPGPGDLQPRCSCPDWADPCKHAAAVCYLVADALDDDPFALFALRGRPRDALMAQVRAARRAGSSPGRDGPTTPADGTDDGAAAPAGGPPPDPGVPARQAWADWHPPSEGAPSGRSHGPVPDHPGSAAAWPADPPEGAPFTDEGLVALAGDAATRAWAQLRGEGDSALSLPPEADLARRAAAVLGRGDALSRLASATGTTSVELARRAIAWGHGGVAALAIMDAEGWRPPVATMAEARRAVAEAVGPGTPVRVATNRVTAGPVQLRLDRQGRWWRFEKRRGRWEVAAPPADEPDDLLGDLVGDRF